MILGSGGAGPSARRKPRASGDDPDDPLDGDASAGVNPARAGMIRIRASAHSGSRRKPRASGDDPVSASGETSHDT